MSPEDMATMKVTRKDLVKDCAAKLLAELEQDRRTAEGATVYARTEFDELVETQVIANHTDDINLVLEACEGRSERVAYTVCCEINHGRDIPGHALVVVQDGTDYDYNFRLQFSVPIIERMWLLADDVRKAQRHSVELNKRSVRVSDMDRKAREKLITDTLDSTEHGKIALDALKKMRTEIKEKL